MTIATTLEKTLDKTPLYAVVGVGDVAVATLRNARAELNARAASIDPNAFRDQARATVESVQAEVRSAPARAQDLLGEMIATAFTAYGELAGRGKSLVTRVERQQATSDLQEQAKNTVSRAKATSTTAKKQASSTASAAKKATTSTTRTAKKSARRTTTSAKATTTSARKTASATKKATAAAANKTGT